VVHHRLDRGRAYLVPTLAGGEEPHAADDCLGLILAAVDERPRAGLACADFGDGATPIVDPYFGGILAPATVDEGWEPAGHPHGTLMFARRQMLEEVGLFDERYFAYCEETDLGLRAIAAGWEVGLVHGVMLRNPTMRSGSPVTDYLMHRNTCCWCGTTPAGTRVHPLRWPSSTSPRLAQPSYRPWIFSPRVGPGACSTSCGEGTAARPSTCWLPPSRTRTTARA
jgi:hypothetical protein